MKCNVSQEALRAKLPEKTKKLVTDHIQVCATMLFLDSRRTYFSVTTCLLTRLSFREMWPLCALMYTRACRRRHHPLIFCIRTECRWQKFSLSRHPQIHATTKLCGSHENRGRVSAFVQDFRRFHALRRVGCPGSGAEIERVGAGSVKK